eukprot:TRINITY_DN12429_c0_g2_i6.p3 TRINITY_DN12429_c0_g2~~TRINITY_DN12429_c0_g2_i6.p3  ORF type:complete len:178 (+),score=19.63 TRINITY_DN12429_c0_g2_i6:869-1402(+)
MQRCRHANIVRFFGAGQFGKDRNDAPFLVLELLTQGSLEEYLKGHRGLSWSTKMRFFEDIATGMNYIHQQGHIHRDLKSANVLIGGQSDTPRARVSDFGSVKRTLLAAQQRRQVDVSDPSMTAGVGSPLWMSPEVICGADYDNKADVYSYGVMVSWLIVLGSKLMCQCMRICRCGRL